MFILLLACATPSPPDALLVSQAAEPTPAAPVPIERLNAMDPRTPVPLQPMMAWHQKQNMQAHLVAIQGITEALAEEDWEGVKAAAAAIESSPQMATQCEHMGAGAEGFTAMALDFHQRADGIALAAAEKDQKKVLEATAHTLHACTGCHAQYRQDVVDSQTWSARTGSPSPH